MPKVSELPSGTPTVDDIILFVDNADSTTKRSPISGLPISGYTDEQAQDAVGTILVDSSTIDFTYNDATPSITADIIDDSVTFAKLQNINTNRILGRSTAGTGDIQELNVTAIPSLIGLGTSDSPQFAGVNVGHATDTTISRVSAGRIAVEGVNIPTVSSTDTVTNKRIQKRVVTVTQSATPTINTDNGDIFQITGLAQAITSMTSGLTGTPVNGEMIVIQITDNGTARAITWGASFEASTVALPTTTVVSTRMDNLFIWNSVTSKWRILASA